MKILCVIDSLGPGGAERQLVNLAISFRKRGIEVSFLTYSDNSFFKETLLSSNINEICVLEAGYIKRFLKIRKIIRSGNYNVVLSFLEKPNFVCELAALPFRKWRLIVGERSANPRIEKDFTSRFIRLFHFAADYVVANSHKNIEIVKRINPLISKKKCKVIYNMIDFDKWNFNEDYLFLSTGKFVLTILATHKYLKNLDGLIEAVNLLGKEEKNKLKINWYGTREINPDISLSDGMAKIMNYKLQDIFNFYPTTDRAVEIINESDAVGLFSFYEGLPNVVCEGMTLAKPIIVSDISDNSLIIDVPKGGFICNPKDPISIAESLSCLLKCSSAELKTMGSYNREKAKKLFDENIIFDQYNKLFLE